MAASAFGLGKRHWSSPQQCYLHGLCTFYSLLKLFKHHNLHIPGVQQFATSLAIMGTHVSYGITLCYMPTNRRDIPALTRPKLLFKLATQEGCKAELT